MKTSLLLGQKKLRVFSFAIRFLHTLTYHHKVWRPYLVLSILCCSALLVNARTYTSTGASDDWENAAAWTCTGGGCNNNPTPGRDLNNIDVVIQHLINYTGNNPIRVRSNGSITINNGGSLILSTNLNLNSGGLVDINDGRLEIGPGVFNCDGTINVTDGFVLKDGNYNNNGTVNLNNACIELNNGNFNNYATLTGVGTVSALSGNINNTGSWPSSGIEYCASGNTSGVPGTEDCAAVTAFCACIVSNCDILPGYDPTTKVNDLIGSELTSLSNTYDPNNPPRDDIYNILSDAVLIDIIIIDGQRPQVEQYLLNSFNIPTSAYIDNGTNDLLITVRFPINVLDQLNSQTSIINYVRPVFPAIFSTGFITSQGDVAQGSFLARGGYNLSGAGIKIGVLSDSYGTNAAGLNGDIVNGDLPTGANAVTVVQEYPYGQASDEGRAMLQIIHDVAPEAELFFRTGFISEGNFAAGITELADVYNCDVIVDDVTYITAPFLKDGLAAQAIDAASANGVSYFTSAGNFASRSYQGTLAANSNVHDFSGSDDTLQHVELDPGFYLMVLQWEDNFYSIGEINNATTNDLDIYLVDDNGDILYGFNRNNLGGDPFEVLPFEVVNPTSTNILIRRDIGSATNSLEFKYVVFRAGDTGKFDAEYLNLPPLPSALTDNATIVGHANAAGAMTLGAARYNNTTQVEAFSSTGGTPTAGQAGLREKPDFTGPDGVNTSVNLGAPDLEGDGIPNFFGTSAAAPHAGAVAALLIESVNTFGINIGSQSTNEWVRNQLQQTASNGGVHNFVDGYGFISAINAINDFAAPTPQLIALNIENLAAGQSPGDVTFTLILEGAFFDESTQVFFRDQLLDPVTIIDDSTATVVVPPFIGNPPIYVFNPSLPLTNGNDGGPSNTLTFDDPVTQTLQIVVDDKTKKYGEVIPELTWSAIVVETGQPLPQELFDLLAPSISLSTGATYQSLIIDAGYAIFADWDESSLAPAITELFTLETAPGTLTITQMPVTIKPKPLTPITYGDPLPEIEYDYILNGNFTTAIEDEIKGELESQHQTALAVTNGLAVINGIPLIEGVPLVNGEPTIDITDDGIDNGISLSDLTFYVTNSVINQSPTASIEGVPLVNGGVFNANTKIINVGVDLFLQSIIDNGTLSTITNGITMVEGVPLVNGIPLIEGVPLVNGVVPLVEGVPLVNGIPLVEGVPLVNGIPLVEGVPLVNTAGYGNAQQNFLDEFEGTLVILSQADANLQPGENIIISPVSVLTGLDAGTQYIVPGALINDQFIVSYEPNTFTINPAPLTVTVEDETVTYGETPVFTATLSGLKYGDTETDVFGNNLTFSTPCTQCPVAGSPHVISATGPQLFNYDPTYIDGELTVNPAALTVTADDKTVTYGETPVFTATLSGLQYGETETDVFTNNLTFSTPCTQCPVDGSPHTITSTAPAPANYTATYVDGGLTVNPAPLTIMADDKTVTYGETPVFTATLTGLQYGETETDVFTNNLTFSTPCTQCPVDGSPHSITATAPAPANYTATYVDGGLTVNPAPLTITVDNKTVTYGQNPVFTASFSGFQYGETEAGVFGTGLTLSTACTQCDVVNSPHPITSNEPSLSNYTPTYNNGVLTVNPAPLTITVDNKTVTYGQTPAFTASLSGLQYGETEAEVFGSNLSLGTACTQCDVDGSPHTISASAPQPANYTPTYVNGDLTVNPLPITITVDDETLTYGDQTANFSVTSQPATLPYGETLAGVFGTFQFTPDDGCTTATTVSVDPQPDPANYAPAYVSGNLTITPAELLLTINNDFATEGDPLPTTFSSSFSGLACGDTPPSVSYTVQGASDPLVAGVFPVNASTSVDANKYNLTIQNGTLYVNPTGGCNDKIRAQIDCREDLSTPVNGFNIRLRLRYENDNLNTIYVPHGDDNRITPQSATYDGTIPEVFLPNTVAYFDIYTNAANIKWELRTFGCLSKSRTGSNANACSTAYTSQPNTNPNLTTPFSSSLEKLDDAQSAEIQVYPNPTDGWSYLKVNLEKARDLRVEVMDARGRLLHQHNLPNVMSEKIRIDLDNELPGLYFIQVHDGERMRLFRLVRL